MPGRHNRSTGQPVKKEDILKKLETERENRKKHYDRRRRTEDRYDLGEEVWLATNYQSDKLGKFSKKLAPHWMGPLRVVRKLGSTTYELTDGLTLRRAQVHQMKKVV